MLLGGLGQMGVGGLAGAHGATTAKESQQSKGCDCLHAAIDPPAPTKWAHFFSRLPELLNFRLILMANREVSACLQSALHSGYGMVRQSDGSYSYRGATHEHVKLMRAHCKPSVQVKAAGGIRTLDDLSHLRALGASRIGASATAQIVQEARARLAAGEALVPKAAASGGGGY